MSAGTACPACHKLFDPLGFGFEHYDEAGRYLDQDSGLPVDASGTLSQDGAQIFAFTGLEDLATNLANRPEVGKCVSGYVNAYAYANSVACLGETHRAAFVAGTLGFLDYYASLAGEPSFTRRQ